MGPSLWGITSYYSHTWLALYPGSFGRGKVDHWASSQAPFSLISGKRESLVSTACACAPKLFGILMLVWKRPLHKLDPCTDGIAMLINTVCWTGEGVWVDAGEGVPVEGESYKQPTPRVWKEVLWLLQFLWGWVLIVLYAVIMILLLHRFAAHFNQPVSVYVTCILEAWYIVRSAWITCVQFLFSTYKRWYGIVYSCHWRRQNCEGSE